MVFDLDINNYNFKETLKLFDLMTGCKITTDDVKNAKFKVLSMHPDKSKLPSEYFIFYKRAFEIVLQYYHNQPEVKVEKIIDDKEILYNLNISSTVHDKQIKQQLQSMDVSEFNNYFNSIFDKNMIDNDHSKRQNEKNDWFKKTEPQFLDVNISSSSINSCIDELKQTKKVGGICKYNEARAEIHHFGSNIYDDDEESDSYIYCNPSSKLLFDDLRKVHLNESIFNIDVITKEPKSKFSNCDELRSHRRFETNDLRTPDESNEYEKGLNDKIAYHKRLLEQNQHEIIKTNKYLLLNSKIISKFLRLSNA